MVTQDDQLIFRCFECKKNYQKDFNKDLINRFGNTYEFCNKDINRFILLLRKGIYPYEYIDSWERFDETSFLDKVASYSSLNMEGITSVDYRHAKRVYKEFKFKNLGDLYVRSDTLLLADVFENLRNKCIEIYELNPAHFLSAPGLAWQACLKNTEVKLELLTDIDMLFMVEKGIRAGICQAVHRFAKANNEYMKSYHKNIESLYLLYLDVNNLYGWVMSQKLPVNGFEWVKKLSKFDERFIKNMMKTVIRDIFLKLMLSIQKICLVFIAIYHFYLKERKSKNVISLFATFMTKSCTKSWLNTKKVHIINMHGLIKSMIETIP